MYQCVIKPKVHFAPEFSFNTFFSNSLKKQLLASERGLFVLFTWMSQ